MPSPLDLQASVHASRGAADASHAEPLARLPNALLLFSFLTGLICTACGAVGSGPPPVVTVTVAPNSAQPFQGESVQFNASVTGASNTGVAWSVQGVGCSGSACGTINASGYYTAPAVVPTPPMVTVIAELQSDSTKTGFASVNIQSLSAIQALSLSPKLSSVTTSQTLQLNVTTAGIGNSDVIWAASGGSITASGLFTPPLTAGPNEITATLKGNTNAIGSATVEVTDFPGMLTWRNDNSRSGVNSKELALTPSTVGPTKFGKLAFSCPIEGYAYAQPLYVPNLAIPGNGVHNVVFVATEKDLVYAFDADASTCELWHMSLVPKGSEAVLAPTSDITSTDIVPFIGITGTPVISLTSSVIYAVAKTMIPGSSSLNPNATYDQKLYALDLATGQQKTSPLDIALPNPLPAFSSRLQNQRAALLLANGIVYIAFASHVSQDGSDYHGWLLGYDANTLGQTPVFNGTPNANQGGIWQSGGGPSADATGNVFVATGYGPPNQGANYSDSFVRLDANNGLSVADYFTPCDQEQGAAVDADVSPHSASSAPVVLPDSAGSPKEPHLLLGATKEGYLYVLNREALGGFVAGAGACSDSPRVQSVPVGDGPIMSTPVFWNNAVYVAAGKGALKSFPLTGGSLSSAASSQSLETFGPYGATPVISSNGSNNAILWLIDSGANGQAILRAYDPNNLSKELYDSTMAAASRDQAGPAVKFTVPTVANGKVYVGTQTELDVYGLLP
jgi:hypothetical protein